MCRKLHETIIATFITGFCTILFTTYLTTGKNGFLRSHSIDLANPPVSEADMAVDTLWFPELRKLIVEDLNQLVTNTIWSISDTNSTEIEKLHKELLTQINNMKSLIHVPRLPLGHHMHRCAERRNKILIKCLIAAAQAIGKPGYLADCGMALSVISKRIGGIRLVGHEDDEIANEMDKQARVFWRQSGTQGECNDVGRMTCFNDREIGKLVLY